MEWSNKQRLRRLALLSGQEWVYLLSLLVPLVAYNITVRVLGLAALGENQGLLPDSLSLLRSEVLFNLGYVVLWVGLFLLVKWWTVLRWIYLFFFHAVSLLVVVITTSSYHYFKTTGFTLDYGIVAYYLAAPGEARGAIESEASLGVWLLLSGAILYVMVGPLLITQGFLKLQQRWRDSRTRGTAPDGLAPAGGVSGGEEEPVPEDVAGSDGTEPARRRLSRQKFLVASVGATAGVFLLRESLLPYAAEGKGQFARASVSNLVVTRREESYMREAVESVEAADTLVNVRLEPTPRTRKRHVALIHLESVRERSVTPYNEYISTTPYLDGLAQESLFVERAYTTQPHTTNAITSVNAGVYPYPGTEIVEAQPGGVPARALARLLREQGYRAAWFQSATGGFEDRAQLVENFGYQHYQALESMDTAGFDRTNYLGYEDDIMLEPSRRWLEEDLETPSLVMFLGVTPHHDYLVPRRYGRRSFAEEEMLDRYLNNVRYDDFWVRNIIEQYKALGLYEDTIFVIYGDHGEAFGEHGRYQHDGVIWEEGVRVPLLVHDPQRFSHGARVEGPANLNDLAPTIVDLLGYRVVDGEYPGYSLLDPPRARTLYVSCRPDLLSMASIKGYEKYIYHFGKQPEEFYDLSRDPLEQNNLSDRLGWRERERLRSDLLEWHAESSAYYEQGSVSS